MSNLSGGKASFIKSEYKHLMKQIEKWHSSMRGKNQKSSVGNVNQHAFDNFFRDMDVLCKYVWVGVCVWAGVEIFQEYMTVE